MTDANDNNKTPTAGEGDEQATTSERLKLRQTIDEMREQVMEVLDKAREDASKTWKEDKVVLKEKLIDIDKVKEDLEERFDKGKAKAQETWNEDMEEIQEKVDDVKKALKGGWNQLAEKTAGLLNKLLD
jgi:phosphoenolpyruvate-protein kinase (PTS system EI component)